jgi:DNA-binding NarL/FixJ family response regulator
LRERAARRAATRRSVDSLAAHFPALTVRELQVTRLVCLGHSNKRIASELQVCCGTVSVHIQRVLSKLDLASRRDLIVICGEHIDREGARAVTRVSSATTLLTKAEYEVLSQLLRGKSNAEIANQRRRSARTVAFQVSSVLRKLSAGSRAELVAVFSNERPALALPS